MERKQRVSRNIPDGEWRAEDLALLDACKSLVRIIPLIMAFDLILVITYFTDINGDRSSSLGILYLLGYLLLFSVSCMTLGLLLMYGDDVRRHFRVLFETQIVYAWFLPVWATLTAVVDAVQHSNTFNGLLYIITVLVILAACDMSPGKWVVIQATTGIVMIASCFIAPLDDHFTFTSELFVYVMISEFVGMYLIKTKWKSYRQQEKLFGSLARAEIDELTGLSTRQAFLRKAARRLQENPEKHYDMIISDIEGFKQINRNYGEKTGDALLRYVGAYLKEHGTPGFLVGHLGQDQFVALTEHDGTMTEEVLSHMMEDMCAGSPVRSFVTKFGIYEDVDHGRPMTELLDSTMAALRSIKHQYGKICGKYDWFVQGRLLQEQKLEADMMRAYDHGEFEVFYQPKHDTQTGRLVGAEALIRWKHPELGFVPPDNFVPFFEHNGFIVKADYYVWRRVACRLDGWRRRGLNPPPVSVNASRRDFEEENVAETLFGIMKEHGLPSGSIRLEVTESAFTERPKEVSATLVQLREGGVCVELDDFGTGYSSLNMLGELPLDTVKFDCSFIRQIHDSRRLQVLSSSIFLAHKLGLSTVCEGVETEEHLSTARQLGCDTVQGYFYARPMSEADFEQYIRRYSVSDETDIKDIAGKII